MMTSGKALFSVYECNSRIRGYDGWGHGECPPDVYPSVSEGQAGGIPKMAAHLHYTSGQMMHLLQHGVGLFEKMFHARHAAALAANPTLAERKSLQDKFRAWESFKALCRWFLLVLRPSFTIAEVVQLDQAYGDYQV